MQMELINSNDKERLVWSDDNAKGRAVHRDSHP